MSLPSACRHKWFMYFSNCTVHMNNIKEMCGNCLTQRSDLAESNHERLREMERKIKSMPQGRRGVRAVPQMDPHK